MALRIRRSITVGEGVRTGAQNAAYTVNPFGPRRTGQGRRKGASATPTPTWSIPAKPGVLAPPLEREFFMGLEELKRGEPQLALERFESAARRDKGDRALSDDLLAGLTAVHVRDAVRAVPHLEAVVASDAGLPDALLLKYAPELAFEVSITPEVSALIPAGSMAAALALVECYQEVGRHEEAIGVLQQLVEGEREPALTLSLCELYAEAGDWEEVAALGAGIANGDDLTLQILLYRATALLRRGDDEEAIEAFDEALAATKRSPRLLTEARLGRGATLQRLGRTAQARGDLTRLLNDDG
jgi:tetratricopeptide (TPR) repeat protein